MTAASLSPATHRAGTSSGLVDDVFAEMAYWFARVSACLFPPRYFVQGMRFLGRSPNGRLRRAGLRSTLAVLLSMYICMLIGIASIL